MGDNDGGVVADISAAVGAAGFDSGLAVAFGSLFGLAFGSGLASGLASGLDSSLGAEIHTDWIEGSNDGSNAISPFLKNLELNDRLSLVLAGGDDYELLFTVPASLRQTVLALAQRLETPLTRIGVMVSQEGLRVLGSEGQEVKVQLHSYEHFS